LESKHHKNKKHGNKSRSHDKTSSYVKSVYRLKKTIEHKLTHIRDEDKREDLEIMLSNVKVLCDHVWIAIFSRKKEKSFYLGFVLFIFLGFVLFIFLGFVLFIFLGFVLFIFLGFVLFMFLGFVLVDLPVFNHLRLRRHLLPSRTN
jgi:hypothetical protein